MKFQKKLSLEDGRYIWCHNSVLIFIAKSLSSILHCLVYAELPFSISFAYIYVLGSMVSFAYIYALGSMVGFQTNIEINSHRKATQYKPILLDLKPQYHKISFRNMYMDALGSLESSSDSMLRVMKELGIDKCTQAAIITTIMSIAMKCTYYVFYIRKKACTYPEQLNFSLNFSCFFSNLFFSSFLCSIYSFFIVCYCTTITLFFMPIICCLLISEMYNCNF